MTRVLDVGGSYMPLNTSTHVIDLVKPKIERKLVADLDVRFTADTCISHDICQKPWPYPDKFFDYSFCAGTLEDIRDPVGLARN